MRKEQFPAGNTSAQINSAVEMIFFVRSVVVLNGYIFSQSGSILLTISVYAFLSRLSHRPNVAPRAFWRDKFSLVFIGVRILLWWALPIELRISSFSLIIRPLSWAQATPLRFLRSINQLAGQAYCKAINFDKGWFGLINFGAFILLSNCE